MTTPAGPTPGAGSRPAPRAVGRRSPYGAVPAAVRAWVDDVLGSPVVETLEQTGGFSPGCATRVRCADGTRAFVKAVGAELNPDTPALFRREVEALGLLGSHPLWADLVASRDADGWVALVLEDVDGTHPDLADDVVMARLLASTDDLVAVLQDRVPVPPPSPPPTSRPPGPDVPAFFRPGPVRLTDVWADWLVSFDSATARADTPLPAWVRRGAADLRGGVADLATCPTGHVVHHDVRDDNLLQRPTGEIVFVDWGAFGTGPDWLDPLLARLERVHLPWFDDSLAASPALRRAGDARVTSWLVGMGVHLAWRAHSATDVNLPTLSAFRRRESARLLGAAHRRLTTAGDLSGSEPRC